MSDRALRLVGAATVYHPAVPAALYFTESDEANELLAREPLALLIGFALDQQVTVPTAFAGPQKLKERIGGLDASAIASMDPGELEAAFREKPGDPPLPGLDGEARPGACARSSSTSTTGTPSASGPRLRARPT